MIFANPICRVFPKVLPDGPAILSVEVDALPPVCSVLFREIKRRELGQVVAVRPEVVVNDVQNNGDAESMRLIHKTSHVLRPPVERCGRVRLDAIVAPSELPR